jgi:hypothetical protein
MVIGDRVFDNHILHEFCMLIVGPCTDLVNVTFIAPTAFTLFSLEVDVVFSELTIQDVDLGSV